MIIDEVEVWLTANGLGRAAIVRRPDGLFCIYVHLLLPEGALLGGRPIVPAGRASWIGDATPLSELYRDEDPRAGIYGTLEDARREVLSITGFSDASPVTPDADYSESAS